LCAFLQRAVPRGISFRFNKLIALQIPKDGQCSVVSVSMIRAYNTSTLHKYVTAASNRGEHKLQVTNLITVYLNVACDSSKRKVVNWYKMWTSEVQNHTIFSADANVTDKGHQPRDEWYWSPYYATRKAGSSWVDLTKLASIIFHLTVSSSCWLEGGGNFCNSVKKGKTVSTLQKQVVM
jgi:hypothetical protein